MAKKLIPEIIKKGILPLFIIVILTVLYLLYSINIKQVLNEELNGYIHKAFLALFIVLVSLWLQRVCGAIVAWYGGVAEKTRTRWDDEFAPLLKRVTNLIIWIIAVLIILSNFGININALIAALGVGSLAIALAAQDTIANIISGFLIMIDRPFRVGDKVKLPSGEKVEVLDIGIRRSKFLSEEGAIIIVPNLELSKQKITNFTYGQERKR